ncbi:hypothetical protein [Algisphaera agarilytica]|uniref:Thiosulfate dehydrogenase [quinone] large subunit n=1 Tax=Algisphaera agarilytica TaxID=1385975 RepID=A0A7X0H8N6_9BACT|nr:hypothetical protein [Algisphaera agarilytica]MBB6431337.1 thiosulfate dehydrogenase [quinone] large subunit [Algisphaera agarilytica]
MKQQQESDVPQADSGLSLAFITLRLWLAARALVTGLEKFSGSKVSDAAVTIDGEVNSYGLTASDSEKVYGLEYYQGVPEALYSKFVSEPLIPEFALSLYDKVLGPALLILGVTLLLGVFTRLSLFLMGLLYTSLTLGLILIKQDAGVAWLGIHVLMVAVALMNVKHNRLALIKKW